MWESAAGAIFYCYPQPFTSSVSLFYIVSLSFYLTLSLFLVSISLYNCSACNSVDISYLIVNRLDGFKMLHSTQYWDLLKLHTDYLNFWHAKLFVPFHYIVISSSSFLEHYKFRHVIERYLHHTEKVFLAQKICFLPIIMID